MLMPECIYRQADGVGTKYLPCCFEILPLVAEQDGGGIHCDACQPLFLNGTQVLENRYLRPMLDISHNQSSPGMVLYQLSLSTINSHLCNSSVLHEHVLVMTMCVL